MARSPAVCRQAVGGSGEQPRVAGTLWLLGSPSKRETPGSIWGSSACLCFKHSLHKRKNFPEFYGSVYVKVSFAISRTANAVGVFYQSSPSLERDPEQWEPAQGVGLSKPQDTCSFVPDCVCGLFVFVMVRLSSVMTPLSGCVEFWALAL